MILPLPRVGQDKRRTDLQKRSDAAPDDAGDSADPRHAWRHRPESLIDYILKQFGVDRHARTKIVPTRIGDTSHADTGHPDAGWVYHTGGVGEPGAAGPQGHPGQDDVAA